MKLIWLALCLSLVLPSAYSQIGSDSLTRANRWDGKLERTDPIYHRNWWVSGSVIVAGAAANRIFLPKIKDKAPTPVAELPSRGEASISKFNQWALEQDPKQRRHYQRLSDYVFNGATLLPFTLLFDSEIREDWLDFGLLYLGTYALNGMLYAVGPASPQYTDRFRPVVYYPEIDRKTRTDGENRNSFYSGHVSTIATATFFTAKVYADYHPELGNHRFLLYGFALLPPTASAVFRIKGLKHFPTDTVVGGVIGAATGLLIPTLHGRWLADGKQGGLALLPHYQPAFKGVSLSLRF